MPKKTKMYNGAHRAPLALLDIAYYIMIVVAILCVSATGALYIFFLGAALGWW